MGWILRETALTSYLYVEVEIHEMCYNVTMSSPVYVHFDLFEPRALVVHQILGELTI